MNTSETTLDARRLSDLIAEAANWASDAAQLRPGGQVETYLDMITVRLDQLVALTTPGVSEEHRAHALRSLIGKVDT